jgi:hypothetical protein
MLPQMALYFVIGSDNIFWQCSDTCYTRVATFVTEFFILIAVPKTAIPIVGRLPTQGEPQEAVGLEILTAVVKDVATSCLTTCYTLIFDPEDGCDTSLRNVGSFMD